jgi:pyridoxamine 5'-phosphate oxidase-like protein
MTTTTEPIAELLFSAADNVPISVDEATIKPWAEARESFAASPKYWLATGRSNGSPHVMPVLAVWLDGAVYVATRPGSLKGKNLRRNPRCVLTVSGETTDLVVECAATEVTGDAELQRVADAFEAKYQWRLTVRDGRAHEDSLPGSPVYGFYQLAPTTAFGFGADGGTATRWRF